MPPLQNGLFELEFPQSLGVYDKYADAQKVVDHLSDEEFPVENVLIVGTDLRQVERVTGRLTWGRVLSAGAASGAWLGLLIGALLSIFATETSVIATILGGVVFGIAFGAISGALGYGATRGQRDFSSVQRVVATRYEVLVEHKLLGRAQELVSQQPGLRPDPFA